MNLRTKVLILNASIVLTLLVELHYHSTAIVGVSSLVLLLTVNLAVFIRARRKRRSGK